MENVGSLAIVSPAETQRRFDGPLDRVRREENLFLSHISWKNPISASTPAPSTSITPNSPTAHDEPNALGLLDRLNWRYATKKMDATRKVAKEKVDRIIEAARLAPTSSGLQPFEIVVVTDAAVRERFKAISWNQGQITDCSHLLVFAAWDNYTAERINMMFDLTNDVRGMRNEGWENYRAMLLNTYPQCGEEVNFAHAARQVFFANKVVDSLHSDITRLAAF